jgi:hypothetical protein
MSTILSQWLPILVSAVAVFVVSSIVHTALRFWHAKDQSALPNEIAVADLLRPVPAGDYRIPFATGPEEMRTEEFKARAAKGPMAVVTIMAGDMMSSFKRALIQWFVYSIIVSWLAGHVASSALGPDASSMLIFHTVGITAFMGYGMAMAQGPIWGGKPWLPAIKSMVDALLYASVTAGVFVWLWK